MAEELKACRHGRNFCLECHYDPASPSKTLPQMYEEMMAENAALRAQLPSQGGEAVAEYQHLSRYGNWDRIDKVAFDLGKLGSCPEKFRALYTHPADQVADSVVVSRELLDRLFKADADFAREGSASSTLDAIARYDGAMDELLALLNGGRS
jgi:hypothetical protein